MRGGTDIPGNPGGTHFARLGTCHVGQDDDDQQAHDLLSAIMPPIHTGPSSREPLPIGRDGERTATQDTDRSASPPTAHAERSVADLVWVMAPTACRSGTSVRGSDRQWKAARSRLHRYSAGPALRTGSSMQDSLAGEPTLEESFQTGYRAFSLPASRYAKMGTRRIDLTGEALNHPDLRLVFRHVRSVSHTSIPRSTGPIPG